MNYRRWLVVAMVLGLATGVSALDYAGLNAVKQMRVEKRYEESVQKLVAMAGSAASDGEQFHYLQLATDIAAESLKDLDRARVLADTIRDSARRDFAQLQLLWRFKKYDDALKRVQGKAIDEWPVGCRGSAHVILADIYRLRADEPAALEHYAKAILAAGAEASVRGGAAREAGMIYLKQGNRAKAEEMFRKAMDASPAAYAWRNESLIKLSGMLIQDQRSAEAVKLFAGIDFDKLDIPHWKSSLLDAYARALLADGQKIKAIETFDRLLQSGISKEQQAKIEKELDKLADEM
jgi:tetratricopeptide (TPR) repeat protein